MLTKANGRVAAMMRAMTNVGRQILNVWYRFNSTSARQYSMVSNTIEACSHAHEEQTYASDEIM
jgi:hypothetical protein